LPYFEATRKDNKPFIISDFLMGSFNLQSKFELNKQLVKRIPYIISGIILLMLLPLIGQVHLFDWDEINFAEAAREMLILGDYLTVRINYQPFWEKPPLFIWMQALSMHIFGINEFSARFPNTIAAIFTIFFLWYIGKKVFSTRFSILWSVIYIASILPFFYFGTGIIDPWFNLFIFASIVFLILFFERTGNNSGTYYLLLSAFCISLAILTKGPVALLLLMLIFAIWLFINKFRVNATLWHLTVYFFIVVFVGGFWFILQILTGHGNLVLEFIHYQLRLASTADAGHGGLIFYHVIVLLVGVFPASVFAIPLIGSKIKDNISIQRQFALWMQITFWVTLILFSIVKTKIVHYSSLCYFPLTFLASYYVISLIEGKNHYPVWLHRWFGIQSVITALLPVLVILILKNRFWFINTGRIQDPFAIGNLQAAVNFVGIEWIGGGILFFLAMRALQYLKTRQYFRGTILLSVGTLLFTWLSMIFFVPQIETITQRAAIEFYKSKQQENCLVMTLGFKSYAHLFYTARTPEESRFVSLGEELYKGKAPIPVYAVAKIHRKDTYLNRYPMLRVLYEKNGFVFMQVIPSETSMSVDNTTNQ